MPPKERPTKRYLCHYHWDGSRWALEIHAHDRADAEARCKALGRLRLDGELVASIPVPRGWPARLLARLLRPRG